MCKYDDTPGVLNATCSRSSPQTYVLDQVLSCDGLCTQGANVALSDAQTTARSTVDKTTASIDTATWISWLWMQYWSISTCSVAAWSAATWSYGMRDPYLRNISSFAPLLLTHGPAVSCFHSYDQLRLHVVRSSLRRFYCLSFC